MRKELEYPWIDETKIAPVCTLIDAIASGDDVDLLNDLEKLNSCTGKIHNPEEFYEYWEWTDLDIIARLALTPPPPCIRDLTKAEITELVIFIQNALCNGDDVFGEYYIDLLHISLPLTDVWVYISSEEAPEEIADKMISASRDGVIVL